MIYTYRFIGKKAIHLILLFVFLIAYSCAKDEFETIDSISDLIPSSYNIEPTYTTKKFDLQLLSPPHRTGPNPLATSEFSKLPITIWVPENISQPIPTIIYSHGGGSRMQPGESGSAWGAFLAQSGYAFIGMHHMTRSDEDVVLNICGPLNIDQMNCGLTSYTQYYESTDRPQDAVYIINNLDKISERIGYSLNVNQLAVFGFSGGTNTTHYLSGGRRDATFGTSNQPAYFELQNSKPKAYIAMSSGAGIEGGWTEASLKDISKPYLCTTGIADLSGDIRARFFEQLQGEDQYRFYINSSDAIHVTFNHESKGTPEQIASQHLFHEWLEMITLAFLDAYVLEIDSARAWLRNSDIEAFVHELLNENPSFRTWEFR